VLNLDASPSPIYVEIILLFILCLGRGEISFFTEGSVECFFGEVDARWWIGGE
jgi:hypothetical protein